MARKTLEDWIHEAITDSDKAKPCSAIGLLHETPSGPKEVHTKRFGKGDNSPSNLAALFNGKAQSYAEALPGVQTFWLYAFYGKNEEEARHPFVINGVQEYGGLATEPPTSVGRQSQDMRHTEAMVQMSYRAISEANATVMRAAESAIRRSEVQDATILRLTEENNRAIEYVLNQRFEAMQQEAGRDLERMRYERETGEREKFFRMIPALANTILGADVFPQSSQDTALIEAAFDNLSEDQVKMLAGGLPQEVGGMLLARFGEGLKRKRLAKEAAHQVTVEAGRLPVRPEFDS